MWIDADFIKIANPLPREPWTDGELRSPDRRRMLIEAWIRDLEELRVLTGYDHNVLQQWRDEGYAGPRPQLSVEINAPFAEQEEKAARIKILRQQRAEQRALEDWLEVAQSRQAKEQEQELLRSYPISYAEHLERCRQAEEERRQAALRESLQRARTRERLQAEEEERRRLHRQMAADRAELADKVAAYAADPLNASFELTEGEFNHWCEEIATPEEIDQITEALAVAARFHALPAWQRWMHRQLAPLLA